MAHVRDIEPLSTDKRLVEVYYSPEQALTRAETPRDPKGEAGDRNSSRSNDSRFTGTQTFEEAANLARYGWPKGREAMFEAARDIAASYAHVPNPKLSLDVAGSYPVAALAAAGDPACMVTPTPELEKPQRIVRVLINGCYSHTCSESEINNWGGAIVSWIDAIEAQQTRCEVWLCYPTNITGCQYEPFIRLKRTDDAVDIDALSFWVSHPSSLRRMMFALLERSGRFSGWYGTVSEASKTARELFECYIPAPAYQGGHPCRTREGAFEFIRERMGHVINPRKFDEEDAGGDGDGMDGHED